MSIHITDDEDSIVKLTVTMTHLLYCEDVDSRMSPFKLVNKCQNTSIMV